MCCPRSWAISVGAEPLGRFRCGERDSAGGVGGQAQLGEPAGARAPPNRILFDYELSVGTVPAGIGQAGVERVHSDDAADIRMASVSTFLGVPHAMRVVRRERVLQEKCAARAASSQQQGRRATSCRKGEA